MDNRIESLYYSELTREFYIVGILPNGTITYCYLDNSIYGKIWPEEDARLNDLQQMLIESEFMLLGRL